MGRTDTAVKNGRIALPAGRRFKIKLNEINTLCTGKDNISKFFSTQNNRCVFCKCAGETIEHEHVLLDCFHRISSWFDLQNNFSKISSATNKD